jgi:hypothetical protein
MNNNNNNINNNNNNNNNNEDVLKQFSARLEALHNAVHSADKFSQLLNAIVMIATPPAPHAGAHAVPTLEAAIQMFYQQMEEEEPHNMNLNLSVSEQAAFDAVRQCVIDNINWFNHNQFEATMALEEYVDGMRGGFRKNKSRRKRSTRRSTRSSRGRRMTKRGTRKNMRK